MWRGPSSAQVFIDEASEWAEALAEFSKEEPTREIPEETMREVVEGRLR